MIPKVYAHLPLMSGMFIKDPNDDMLASFVTANFSEPEHAKMRNFFVRLKNMLDYVREDIIAHLCLNITWVGNNTLIISMTSQGNDSLRIGGKIRLLPKANFFHTVKMIYSCNVDEWFVEDDTVYHGSSDKEMSTVTRDSVINYIRLALTQPIELVEYHAALDEYHELTGTRPGFAISPTVGHRAIMYTSYFSVDQMFRSTICRILSDVDRHNLRPYDVVVWVEPTGKDPGELVRDWPQRARKDSSRPRRFDTYVKKCSIGEVVDLYRYIKSIVPCEQ